MSLAPLARPPARSSGAVIVSSSSKRAGAGGDEAGDLVGAEGAEQRPAGGVADDLGREQRAVAQAALVGGGEALEQEAEEGAGAGGGHAGRADEAAQRGALGVREDQQAGAGVEAEHRADRRVAELGGRDGAAREGGDAGEDAGRLEPGVLHLREQEVDLDLLLGDAVEAVVGGAGEARGQGPAHVVAPGREHLDGAVARGGAEAQARAAGLQHQLRGELVAERGQAAGQDPRDHEPVLGDLSLGTWRFRQVSGGREGAHRRLGPAHAGLGVAELPRELGGEGEGEGVVLGDRLEGGEGLADVAVLGEDPGGAAAVAGAGELAGADQRIGVVGREQAGGLEHDDRPRRGGRASRA